MLEVLTVNPEWGHSLMAILACVTPNGIVFKAVLIVNGVSILAILVINRVWFLSLIGYVFKKLLFHHD